MKNIEKAKGMVKICCFRSQAVAPGGNGKEKFRNVISDLHFAPSENRVFLLSEGVDLCLSFPLWRQTPHARKYILSGVCGGVMLFVLLALTPGTDVMAHLGGFIGGLLLGALMNLVPAIAQKPRPEEQICRRGRHGRGGQGGHRFRST